MHLRACAKGQVLEKMTGSMKRAAGALPPALCLRLEVLVRLQLLFGLPGRAVHALQLLVLLVAPPVRARHLQAAVCASHEHPPRSACGCSSDLGKLPVGPPTPPMCVAAGPGACFKVSVAPPAPPACNRGSASQLGDGTPWLRGTFLLQGPAGLAARPQAGHPPSYSNHSLRRVVQMKLLEKYPCGLHDHVRNVTQSLDRPDLGRKRIWAQAARFAAQCVRMGGAAAPTRGRWRRG